MDFDQIYTIILTTIITPLIVWGVAKLSAFLDEKLDTIKNEKFQKAIKAAKEEMEDAVYKAIVETQNTYVEALKADGNFTEAEAIIALHKSIERVKDIMSETSLVILEKASISIDEAIKNEIEIQLPIFQEVKGNVKN